jgi:hypothetical protein
MRTSALALVALIFALAAGRTTLGQLPAGAKIQGIYSTSPKKQQPTSAQQDASEMQYAASEIPASAGEQQRQPVQIVMYIPEPIPGGVQPAGHHHHAAAAQCYPGGGYGPHGHGGHHGLGGHHGYAGGPFHGGHYGYFGGAHRTPGYPHHHLHREYVGPQGPPTAAVAYPYYTVRGPRDFLIDNPPSIGR